MANFKNTLKDSKKETKTTLTASQKLDMLEKSMANLRKMVEILAEEMDKIQQSQIAVAQKLDATLKVASSEEPLSEKAVNDFVISQQVEERKQQIEVLKTQGVLVPSEEVKENAFVIGKEITSEGEVVSPRTQASLKSLPEEVRGALLNKKVGDLVVFKEGTLSFLLDEVYDIVEPKQVELENVGA